MEHIPAEASADITREQNEVKLLNECFSSARAIHLIVSHSLMPTSGAALCSSLLNEEVQSYLREVLHKYSATAAMRKKLKSVKILYFLQCLTDEKVRDEFICAAAHPSFSESL
ncbi:hypothetical protein, conserved [Trypanosoma brucei gambiense DAL972]|uniref:Uncharacterized protein n=1 Tax=Trypanosoma brucei gambiense (strain MHOM/CI/86/DAL972) TaxID=679716 RepID=C9ZYR9_TRYB9|nr:hypothetical protein, conserved [Trypanosoma brucei gambiense DAL972]CBH14568.1 hypothetical protein, conserved [Trypanosoma brucei gambiense DAL972]|eukprot:XP_011776834.1 hypothetical protein, conserved [Trypanosoma brucei gambiense DAL972]